MSDVLDIISKVGIVPVIKLDKPETAVPLVRAVSKGGIPIAEITFRSDAAYEGIKAVSKAMPEILVGAGTVTTKENVDRAIDAGAKFIVTPGFNPKIVSYCIDKKIPVTPGCTTGGEIEAAMELGLKVLKFFPAEQSGGLDKIKAFSGPYGGVSFIPTGGIDLKNIAAYTANDKVIACGGSFMVKDDFIKAGEFDKITELCKNTILTMLDFSFAHMAINNSGVDSANNIAGLFNKMFGFASKDTSLSVFAGPCIEVMKEPNRGKNGHIAIFTSSVDKAKYHLEKWGFVFEESTAKTDNNGKLKAIYLKDEIAGFGVHLLKK